MTSRTMLATVRPMAALLLPTAGAAAAAEQWEATHHRHGDHRQRDVLAAKGHLSERRIAAADARGACRRVRNGPHQRVPADLFGSPRVPSAVAELESNSAPGRPPSSP